jgi:hypothetical protein
MKYKHSLFTNFFKSFKNFDDLPFTGSSLFALKFFSQLIAGTVI